MRPLALLALALAASASAQTLDALVSPDTLVIVVSLENDRAVYGVEGRGGVQTLELPAGGMLMVRAEGVAQAKILVRSGFSDERDVAVARRGEKPGALQISSDLAMVGRSTDLWVFACIQERGNGVCRSWQRAEPRTALSGEANRIQIRRPDPPLPEIDPR